VLKHNWGYAARSPCCKRFAIVVSGMVAVRHGGRELAFKIAGQVVALKQDSVLGRPIPALDRRRNVYIQFMLAGAAPPQLRGADRSTRRIVRAVEVRPIRRAGRISSTRRSKPAPT
jgi:hypothetical protein